MNKEDYVSLEVAQILKDKDIFINNYLYIVTEDCTDPYGKSYKQRDLSYYGFKICDKVVTLLAPHLYNTQKWLREKYKINIVIEDTGESMRYTYTINDMLNQYSHEGICESLEYNSYEECLNKAIEIVLTKMI